ncbi:MAG: hypothetical protein AAF310_03570, partial [Myxococcota bacterium]
MEESWENGRNVPIKENRHRIKCISLENYERDEYGLQRFQKDFQACIRPFVFTMDSIRELIVKSLLCISTVKGLIESGNGGIEEAVKRVIKHWSFLKKESNLEEIILFRDCILGYKRLPLVQLELLTEFKELKEYIGCNEKIIDENLGNSLKNDITEEALVLSSKNETYFNYTLSMYKEFVNNKNYKSEKKKRVRSMIEEIELLIEKMNYDTIFSTEHPEIILKGIQEKFRLFPVNKKKEDDIKNLQKYLKQKLW